MSKAMASGSPMNPTPRQRELLTYIRNWIDYSGYSPTMDDLGEMMELSKTTIHEHIHTLAAGGYLTLEPHKARSTTITEEGRRKIKPFTCPHCGCEI